MSEDRSRNWLKISCMGCVGGPCLMLMLTFGWVKCQVSRIGDSLPGDLAKLKAMGIPTEPADLAPNPPVPDGENAASIYKAIAAEMARLEKEDKTTATLMVSYAGHPTDKSDYEKGLQRYQAAFNLIESLPRRPKLDFNRDYSLGFYVLFPEFAQMKGVSKILNARVRHWVEQGKLDNALRDIECQLMVADHLNEEPTLIGSLVAIACQAIAYASIEYVLVNIRNKPELLAKMESLLLKYQGLTNMRRALVGEMVMGRIGIRSIKSLNEFTSMGMEEVQSHPLDRFTVQDPAVRRMFEAKHVEAWRKFFETAPKEPTDFKGFSKALTTMDARIAADNSLENKVNQIVFPVFSQAGNAALKSQGQKRMNLVAVKLLRMRPTGLPANLNAYGNLAIDPMTEKPIGYLRKGSGFKLWIAGQDGVDNGGVPYVPGITKNRTGTDIVLGFDIGLSPPVVKAVKQGSASSFNPNVGGLE